MSGIVVHLHAVVRDGERAAVTEAAALLGRVLAEAGAACDIVATCHEHAADIPAEPGVVILSAAAELSPEPLAAVRARWQATLATLTARPDAPVVLFTLFRAVGEDAPAEASLERIRRLDLMLVELSHASGACVIDLDRALAHLGARALGADYRLGSAAAVSAAAHTIAATLLAAALDHLLAAEALDAARARLGAWQPPVSAARAAAIADTARGFTTRRDGRRSQVFDAAGAAPKIEGSATALLAQLRAGKIGYLQAGAIVARGVQRMGVRRAVSLAWRELRRRA